MSVRSFSDINAIISFTFFDEEFNERNFNSFETERCLTEKTDVNYILRANFRTHDQSYFAKMNLICNHGIQFAIAVDYPTAKEVRMFGFGTTDIIPKDTIMRLFETKDAKLEISLIMGVVRQEAPMTIKFARKGKLFVVDSIEVISSIELCDKWYARYAKSVEQSRIGPSLHKNE